MAMETKMAILMAIAMEIEIATTMTTVIKLFQKTRYFSDLDITNWFQNITIR